MNYNIEIINYKEYDDDDKYDETYNINSSPSDSEDESPKKPLPVLSYWVCGR